jgi:hypothetical protein
MKKILDITIPMMVFALLVFGILACKDDEPGVPLASTQADFDYEVTEIIVNEDEGIIHYQVTLFNKSILAQSYIWDFGNGETSTEENPVVTYTSAGKYTITLSVAPANDLYYNNLVKSESFAFGKQVILYEDFSEGIDFIDEDSWAPEGWQAIDNDGDGFNWYVGLRQEVLSMRSQSWDGSPLTPDNWLILPELNLTDYDEGASVTFRYTVGITANTPQYRQEHYGIFISVGNDNIDNFELLFEETFTTETPNWTPQERNIDISEYAGDIVFLAIRHFNVTDMDRIFIEEVEVYVIE